MALRYSGLFWIYDVPTKSLNISEHDFGAQKIHMLHAQKQRLIKKATATSKTGRIDRTGKLIKLAPWITLA